MSGVVGISRRQTFTLFKRRK